MSVGVDVGEQSSKKCHRKLFTTVKNKDVTFRNRKLHALASPSQYNTHLSDSILLNCAACLRRGTRISPGLSHLRLSVRSCTLHSLSLPAELRSGPAPHPRIAPTDMQMQHTSTAVRRGTPSLPRRACQPAGVRRLQCAASGPQHDEPPATSLDNIDALLGVAEGELECTQPLHTADAGRATTPHRRRVHASAAIQPSRRPRLVHTSLPLQTPPSPSASADVQQDPDKQLVPWWQLKPKQSAPPRQTLMHPPGEVARFVADQAIYATKLRSGKSTQLGGELDIPQVGRVV